MWTVGQLAKATGLTVRTLHHWDEIGLLAPAERAGNGYRRYGEAELRRVYAIVALRTLGLSLEEIGRWLAGGGDLRSAVDAQLEHVERALREGRGLRGRLLAVRAGLDGDGPSTDDIIRLIEETTMHERYYTPEQREQLAARAAALGDEGMRDAEAQWATLIAEAQALRAAGADPAGPEVQAVIARWDALIEAFTGGDPGIRASLQKMYEEQGSERASRGMVDAELVAWLRGSGRAT